MTKLECRQCGDMIEVTASTVVLPFTCMKCEAAQDEFAGQVYEDMAPKSSLESMAGTPLPADPNGPLDLSGEFATVDNTTTLIADLEEQLAQTKAVLDGRNRESTVLASRIMILETQLEETNHRAIIAMYVKQRHVDFATRAIQYWEREATFARDRLAMYETRNLWERIWS